MVRDTEALVLIELQREWLDEDGKLRSLIHDNEQFDRAVEGAAQVLEYARKHGMRVVHSGLGFQKGYPELGKAVHGLRAAIPHYGTFPADGKGSEFPEPFKPLENEFIVSGRTGGSGFAGSNLDSYLRNQGIRRIYLAGFALHICVESTLRQGHDLGYDVFVIEDACAAFTRDQRMHVLDDVVHHFGMRMTVKDFVCGNSSR